MGVISWIVLAVGCLAVGTAVAFVVRPASRPFMGATIILVIMAFVGGLLGTVLGMMRAYSAAAEANPSEKATLLAQGISEAMNATAFGLAAVILWVPLFVIGAVRRRKLTPPGTSSSDPGRRGFHLVE